jgi:hypothetical protein
MKTVLSILLTLMLAAGPWLCCCTAGHIARTDPAPTSTPAKPSCCGSVTPNTESPDEAPLAPARSCSCQAEVQPATIAAPDSLLPVFSFLDVLPMDGENNFTNLAINLWLVNELALCSFLESRDILRLFHILRC